MAVTTESRLDVDAQVVGAFQVNCYLLSDRETKEAVLVDPGDEAPRLLKWVAQKGFALKAIWLTHAHIDHIMAVNEVREHFKVPVFLHKSDRPLAEQVGAQAALLGLGASGRPVLPDSVLAEGMTLNLGPHRFSVWHTPGHSPGSCCFVTEGRGGEATRVFTGDTLFAGSVGRTDLPGGDGDELEASLTRLLSLKKEVVIYPGHGPESTLERERRMNPFLR